MGYREQNLTLPIISAQFNMQLILFFFHSSPLKPLFCAEEAYEISKLCLIAREPSIHFLDFPFLSLPLMVLPTYSSLECDATSRQFLQFSGFKSAILALILMPTAQVLLCVARPGFCLGVQLRPNWICCRNLCPFS